MKRTGKKVRKIFVTVMAAVAILAILILAYADSMQSTEEKDDTSAVPVIESSVTIGKKTYTKDNPLKIIEIAPLEFQAELGWLIDSDYYNVRFQDIKELILSGNDTDGKALLQSWCGIISSSLGGQYRVQLYVDNKWYETSWEFSENWVPFNSATKLDESLDYRIVDSSGNVYRYKDEYGNVVNSDNIFAYSVFGDYNMIDKIEYEVKAPSELTRDDIDNADLIYINTAASNRDGQYVNFYKNANSYMPDKCPLTKNGVAYTGTETFAGLGEDFTADIAWYLYRTIVNEDIAIIFDTNALSPYFDIDSNAVKLAYLLNGADRDKFKEHFWQNEITEETYYSGTMGTFEVVDNTFKITYTFYNQYEDKGEGALKELTWNQSMFTGSDFLYSICKAEEDAGNYYFASVYTDWITGDDRTTNVWNNVFTYGEWNTLLQKVPAGTITADENMSGSSYNDLMHLYGQEGTVSVGSAIRYILGDYSKLYGTLKVLEIEPAGEYKYDELTDAQASQILRYLQISIKNLVDGSIAGHVEVRSVAMNEFIAMTEDIKSNYDLIIMGDVTDDTYKDNFLNYTYSEYGKNVTYTNYNAATTSEVSNINTVYSGNDLTDKAYDKLKAYVESGRPMVLADSIYNGDISVIDEQSNVYKLSKLAKGSKNVTDESMTLGGRLKYAERPQVSVNGYNVTYNNVAVNMEDGTAVNTQIANINLTREKLSGFEFKVSTGNNQRAYMLEIYVDKNGDGLFEGTGENNELVYNGSYGNYSQKISLPTGLRGYLKWKVVLTDVLTDMSVEEEGAFVIGYGSDEKRTVKVLQICPEDNKLSLKDNSSFLRLFEASSDITGLEMTSEDVTVMTTTQYEEWYKESPYDVSTGAGDKLTKDGETGFDIIVIGFSDTFNYEDISDEYGALSNLVNYIEDGNAVLMSHDVLSYMAYSDTTYTNVNVNLNVKHPEIAGWSYNITSRLRNIIGMDRYGVATEEEKNTESPYSMGYSNSLNLTAYTSYYSNKAGQINNGQINMYPYEIGEDVSVARTHAQYFQLDLNDDDVVVWYALSDDDENNSNTDYKYFSLSGHDALNNYYIYSKGNITYTGAGHSSLSGSYIELQLFVNTIIKAIGSANSLPVVEYENAIRIDNYSYEMTIRDGSLPETITYTATDEDFLGDTNGTFKEGFVFFDVDGDNKYTEGIDILFVEYDNDDSTTAGYIRNMIPETLDFASDTGILTQWRNSGDSQKIEAANTIEAAFENNQLRIIVQVKDNNNGIGRGILNIVNKQLFNLN